MAKFFKIILWFLLGVIILIAIIGLINREKITHLYHVNSLFSEGKIVSNFSSMDKMFKTKNLARSGEVFEFEYDLAQLPQYFLFQGEQVLLKDYLSKTSTTSLMVLSDGKVFFEDYYLGTKKQDKRISWSVAKSFLSALFGIAVSEGKIVSLNDMVTKYVPELKNSAYNGVAIIDVLNMASGVRFDEDYLDYDSDINRMGRVLALGGSMDKFAAAIVEREREAGVARQYTSIDTHVLAMVLRAATGKSLSDLFVEKLWSKIGAKDDAYYVTDGNGVAFALGGLNLRTSDYARFGLLMLKNGKWNGEQIIPLDWALESVKANAPASISTNDNFGYGYQWWVPINADEEFYAIGIYGQYIYINRKAGVVIVKTSADRNFRSDSEDGNNVEQKTIEMFRAIAREASS